MNRISVMVMALGAFAANAARGDLIERKDGSLLVGRVISTDENAIRVRTDAGASTPDEFKVKDIKRVLSPSDELAANLGSSSIDVLEQRAAAYHLAGLEFDALICLERSFALNPKKAAEVNPDGPAAWQAFWSLAIIAIEARSTNDTTRLLSLARQARAVDALGLCADLVARAGVGNGLAEARAVGIELGVPVRPIHRIDLTPCLYESFESQSIEDEDVPIPASPDRVFLHVPVRVDPRVALTLSKGVLRGRDAKGLYGIRPMRVIESVPNWQPGRIEPVYERMDASQSDGEMLFRNLTPPRRAPGDTTPRERTSGKDRRMPASGWVVLIFEVRRGAVSASVQLPGESAEELDLPLIRRVREQVPDWTDLTAKPPEQLASLLDRLDRAAQPPAAKRESLRATTLLAMARLDETRKALADRATGEWRALIFQSVIQSAGGGDPDVGQAAWRFLIAATPLVAGELSRVSARTPNGHFAWAAAIESAWADPTIRNTPAASEILTGILEKGDAVSCARALDTLERLNEPTLWYSLSDGSSGAKKLALARLLGGPAVEPRRQFSVAALVTGINADLAEPILTATRKYGLGINSVDDPVIWAWKRMRDRPAQIAYMEALSLAGADLGGVWHSPAIAAMARDVHRSRNKRILGAWTRLVAAHHGGATDELNGMFPLLVARESSDPELLGLKAIATGGAPADRQSAIRSLMARGFVEEVQRALGNQVDKEWPAVLSAGARKEDHLAVLGLFARWAAGGPAEVAPIAMTHLSRVLSDVEPDRRWQAVAAIKSGLTLDVLNDLSWGVDPASSGAALRVAYSVGHMTQQERERVAGAADQAVRLAELKAVDLRRGQLVDGRYGVLAIVETTTRVETSAGRPYWGEPVRRLMVLPPVRLEVSFTDDKITAMLKNTSIGTGRAIPDDRLVKPLPFYYGVLEALDGDDFVVQGEAPSTQPVVASRPAAIRPGPMVLPDTRALAGAQGSLTLDLGAFAEEMNARAGREKLRFTWPTEYRVMLRYHMMGTWVGCGRRQVLPATARVGDTRLLNIMLIVEKQD